MPDSDPIIIGRTPDDLLAVVFDIAFHIQFKFLGLLLLIFIMLSSDVFINRVLGSFKGAVDLRAPTSWGVFLQGMILVLIMICIDALIRQRVI